MKKAIDIRQIELGHSGIRVPVVGQGTMGLGGRFDRDASRDRQWIRALRQGIDLGLTFIDTAEIYGGGHAEELVGRAVKGCRDRVTIATKFSPEHSGRAPLIKSAENSLRRLRIECLDLLQSHWPNPKVPFEETLAALEKLRAAGKIRCVGLCNTSLAQIAAARQWLGAALVSVQQQYNLLDRFCERDLLPQCRAAGLTFIAYSPLLEGAVAPADGRRAVLERIAARNKLTASQLVLAWLLRHPGLIVIPKAVSLEHLESNAACERRRVPERDFDAISRLYAVKIRRIEPERIDLQDAAGRVVYRTVAEALANRGGMTPSPREVARGILAGEPFRPIKVVRTGAGGKPYCLKEGRLRYWAWRIAYADGRRIPVVVG
jgi:aryl-alcohol dehydrogenase-like predicted oxidoreductase